MKNAFKLSSIMLIGLALFQISCSKDEILALLPPDPSGSWTLKSAILVDGNSATEAADPLVVANLPLAGIPDADIPVGDEARTTGLVGGALAGVACLNPANYGGFFLELTSTNKLVFNCPAEDGGTGLESGTWTIIPDSNGDFTILTLSVSLDGIPVPIAITVSNFTISADGNSFTGQAKGYPMVKDVALPISATGNAQFITTDMEFIKVP